MTQLERLKIRIPEEPDDAVLVEMLESAKDCIMELRFPFSGQEWPYEVEPRYLSTQIDMAVDMYNRLGAEGQLSHSENGISRAWGAEWISDELKRRIVPYAGVI